MRLTAVFEKVPEGYIAFVEELPGANTQGSTIEEARTNLLEAVNLVLEANRILAEEALDGRNVVRVLRSCVASALPLATPPTPRSCRFSRRWRCRDLSLAIVLGCRVRRSICPFPAHADRGVFRYSSCGLQAGAKISERLFTDLFPGGNSLSHSTYRFAAPVEHVFAGAY